MIIAGIITGIIVLLAGSILTRVYKTDLYGWTGNVVLERTGKIMERIGLLITCVFGVIAFFMAM